MLTENEILTIIDRLRVLNVIAWEMVAFVPPKGHGPLLTILEQVINETDALVARFDATAGDNQ